MKPFALAAVLVFAAVPVLAQDAAAEKITYNDHIQPLFKAKCGSCHNANDRKGGLTLDNYAGVMQGGSSGASVEGGDPGASYLWSTGATTQSISVNAPGVYSVTVNGPCGTGTDQVVVTNCSITPCATFLPTGAPQQWVVPAGVDTVRVQMWGAAGGGGPDSVNNFGGGGGYTELILPVVAGDIFQIVVGAGGQPAVGHIDRKSTRLNSSH